MKRLRKGSGSAIGLMPMDCAMAAARVPRSDSSMPWMVKIFSANDKEETLALQSCRMRFQAVGDVENQVAAGAVVHRSVVNAVAVDGSADAHVVDVRGKHDVFIYNGAMDDGSGSALVLDMA